MTLEEQRDQAASELARLETEAADTLDALRAKKDASKRSVEELTAMLAEAKRDYLTAEIAELNAHNQFQSQMAPHRTLLEQTAPTMLRQFISELMGYQARLRGRNVVMGELPKYPKEQEAVLGARWEQQKVIAAWHDMLRESIAAMNEMLHAPVNVHEASEEINRRRQSLNSTRILASRAGVDLN